MRPKAVLSVGYLVWEQKEFTILAADIDPSLVGLLKQADTLEELLVLIKKANLDGSDCGRVQVIPGQWIKNKRLSQVIYFNFPVEIFYRTLIY
jgi:hypothetical protein